MGSRGCDEYGTGWEKGDPVCDECPDEFSCRDRTLKRKKLILEKRRSAKSSGPSTSSNRGVYSYHTNMKYLLPEEGESAWHRILKNIIAGALSSIGGEIYAFFQEWRWPFKPPEPTALPEPKPEPLSEPAKSSVKSSPKSKRPQVAKRIRVKDLDEDDEFDFDLDDL
jgi:hypothetical protein